MKAGEEAGGGVQVVETAPSGLGELPAPVDADQEKKGRVKLGGEELEAAIEPGD
jgi:hypothetical protein